MTLGCLLASACASSTTLARPAPFPTMTNAMAAAAAPAVVDFALSLRGTPYHFGGSTPDSGFDCSGFVSYVFSRYSVHVPRSVAEQFTVGTPIDRQRLQAGDLVFFSTLGPGATHVGIVTSPEQAEFVHAPADGASVRVERFDAAYWRTRWVGARRVF